MTSAVQPVTDKADVRTIVGGGAVLGGITAVGVTVFALLSRQLAGTAEVVVQSALVLVGAGVFCYFPVRWVRPTNVDGIAWAALLGLMGSLFFTVVDTIVLRPVGLYHWTWDAIGGGSGFWYIPVWWMASATLAWLGAWIASLTSHGDPDRTIMPSVATTIVLSIAVFAVLAGARWAPVHGAVMALGVAIALPLHVAGAWMKARR
jgi:hypothetical protein